MHPQRGTEQRGPAANVPAPPSERGSWLLAGALALLGAVALTAALLFGTSSGPAPRAAPPPIVAVASTPTPALAAGAAPPGTSPLAPAPIPKKPGPAGPAVSHRAPGKIVADPSARQQQLDATRFVGETQTHIAKRWIEGFYPIYATAQRTFGVNWLLIASIHRQESAFSTAPGIYRGLNFAGCCGGPMQFNVKNGGPPGGSGSTWSLVSDSYRYGARPASYDHMTVRHPSIYDDFDSVMAAAHLLSTDGAGLQLDGSAWNAAYAYYGHDSTGVTYADQVLSRAISWSQHGFCINCGVPQAMVEAVHAAYGAPAASSLQATAATATKPRGHRRRH